MQLVEAELFIYLYRNIYGATSKYMHKKAQTSQLPRQIIDLKSQSK